MMTLYYYNLSSFSRSVLTGINAMQLKDIEYISINSMNGDTTKPEFMVINPLHSVPVLIDGDLKLLER